MAKSKRAVRKTPSRKAKAAKTTERRVRKTADGSSNQARVLAAFGGRARTIEAVCEATGLEPRQVRASIDRLRAAGTKIKGAGRGQFQVA